MDTKRDTYIVTVTRVCYDTNEEEEVFQADFEFNSNKDVAGCCRQALSMSLTGCSDLD